MIDKVYRPRTLMAAWRRVRAAGGAAGTDRQSLKAFERRLDANLAKLHEELKTATYRPQPIRRSYIDKPGSREKRPLGIPAVRDRIVQTALKMVLEPIFEWAFVPSSFGFRPGQGCKDALQRVEGLMRGGYTWVIDADDFVILCQSQQEAKAALARVTDLVGERGLSLHADKTSVVATHEAGQGFDFLGYPFENESR